MQEMSWVRESSLWQIAVDEGRDEGREEGRLSEARRLVISLASERLGLPDLSTRSQVEVIDDLDRLERMVRRTFTAGSWQELVATT